MCFAYNQTRYGRLINWVTLWKDYYGESPSSHEYAILSKFSGLYGDFLD
jgi:hypothetical protein